MHIQIKEEFRELNHFINRNKNEILVISLSALFLILSRYHRFEPRWFNYSIYLAALPILSIAAILRKNPLNFGLKAGDYKIWILHVAVICIVISGLIYAASRLTSVQRYYSESGINLFTYFIERLIIIFSIEFFFPRFPHFWT